VDRKGFTLVELLGVIIILIILALISSRAVTKYVKGAKIDLTETQKENIKSSVYFWIEDNILDDNLPDDVGDENCSIMPLNTFNEYLNTNTLSSDIINSDDISVKICKNDSNDVSYSVEIEES